MDPYAGFGKPIPALLMVSASAGRKFGGELMMKRGEVPFVPRKGDMLDLGEGTYREVDSIFWHYREGLTVWFCDDDSTCETLAGDGWVHEADFDTAH